MPATFYAGDALGSFNSIMRWMTGLSAGLGIVWFLFPYLLHTCYQQLDEVNYVKGIEQVQRQDPRPTRG